MSRDTSTTDDEPTAETLRAHLAASSAKLTSIEVHWRDRQPFLQTKGYMLRPRYRPDWIPSWQGRDLLALTAEDAITHPVSISLRHTRTDRYSTNTVPSEPYRCNADLGWPIGVFERGENWR